MPKVIDSRPLWQIADESIPADIKDAAERWRLKHTLREIWRSAFMAGWRASRQQPVEHPEDFGARLEKLAELEMLFDTCWKADRRAIKRWQEAHPGNDNVWPDHADMVVWLMEQLDKARMHASGRTRAGNDISGI